MRLSAELEAPPGRGGDAGRSRGSYGVPCGYMSGDLLLTSQVPQGNLETMMRILINNSPGTPREETEEVAEVAMIRVNGR